jgi:histone deacetylase 11
MKEIVMNYSLIFSFFAIGSFVTCFASNNNKVPFVYNANYDISFFGIEKIHPFDTHKYSKVANYLKFKLRFLEEQFHKPEQVTQEELETVHTSNYLDTIQGSWKYLLLRMGILAGIGLLSTQFSYLAAFGLKTKIIFSFWNSPQTVSAYGRGFASPIAVISLFIPRFILNYVLLRPMRFATGGTILAVEKALDPSGSGWAVNCSGGYHHAKENNGDGFCFYNDIAIALKKAWKKNSKLKVLYVDLDAHQGDGVAETLQHECIKLVNNRFWIFDIYGKNNYPQSLPYNKLMREMIKFNHPVTIGNKKPNGTAYFEHLKTLENAIAQTKPDLIFYNAGTDVYELDPLGGMGLTKEDIIQRDAYVFRMAKKYNAKIVMTFSGGYHPDSAQIIGESLVNIYQNVMAKEEDLEREIL